MKNGSSESWNTKVIAGVFYLAALTVTGEAFACPGDAPAPDKTPIVGLSADGKHVEIEVGEYAMAYREGAYDVRNTRCDDPRDIRAVTQVVKFLCDPYVDIDVNFQVKGNIVPRTDEKARNAAYARIQPVFAADCAQLLKAADAEEALLPKPPTAPSSNDPTANWGVPNKNGYYVKGNIPSLNP